MTDKARDIVDWAHFEKSRTELGPGFIRILSYFKEDGVKSIAQIELAMHQQNTAALVLPAHTLKGESRQLGAEPLAKVAELIESTARFCVESHRFPDELVPEAPDVVIQIAHMAGGGAPGDQLAEQALDTLSEAMAKADPRTKLLYFDASGMSAQIAVPEEAARLATRMRQIGLERILFGSDGATGGNAPPREAWTAFRNLPLTEPEFRAIAVNVPPYLRK